MAAQLHLAEDALALHLLFQHLESLVDIVVADENLQVVFLFDRAIERSDGQVPGQLAHGYAEFECRWHPQTGPTTIS